MTTAGNANSNSSGDDHDGGLRYRRALLKISGEALLGDGEYGVDFATVRRIAEDVKQVHDLGAEVCLVIGGGNIFRGISGATVGMERTTADYMGMLATVMNALAMQSALEGIGLPTRVLSAIPMSTVCEPYIRRRAMRHMEKGRIVNQEPIRRIALRQGFDDPGRLYRKGWPYFFGTDRQTDSRQ